MSPFLDRTENNKYIYMYVYISTYIDKSIYIHIYGCIYLHTHSTSRCSITQYRKTTAVNPHLVSSFCEGASDLLNVSLSKNTLVFFAFIKFACKPSKCQLNFKIPGNSSVSCVDLAGRQANRHHAFCFVFNLGTRCQFVAWTLRLGLFLCTKSLMLL